MAKSPQQIAAIDLDSALLWTNGLRPGNPGLGTSLQQALQSWLNLGLVQWRHRLAHPQEAFKNAIAAADRGFQLLLAEMTREVIWDNYVLETADILRLLLGQPVDSSDRENLVEQSVFDDEFRALNVQFVVSLSRKTLWGKWTDILNAKHSKQDRLVYETYHGYHDALNCFQQGNIDGLIAAIENCAQCYLKRKKDRCYAESISSEGGGAFNDLVVDYYLSALIKQLLPASELPRLSANASIHVYPE